MDLIQFNKLPLDQAKEKLFNCCGSTSWVEKLSKHFPFENEMTLFNQAREIWYSECNNADYLEAFQHHPKIGDVDSLKKKFANTSDWAGNEQSGVNTAAEKTIQELASFNESYFIKNDYIFIVCATGKSASEMLQLLKVRHEHSREEEMNIAMGEQFKITLIRLKKLIDLEMPEWNQVSQVTTHVLDTSIGTPGKGICIKLKKPVNGIFQTLALGFTNKDGRIPDLLPAGVNLEPGHYQMCFDTKSYFEDLKITGFYPKVDIDFNTFDDTHYHVPLLINPYGYSTYRGS